MKRNLFIISLLIINSLSAQIYTPNGIVSGPTINGSTGNVSIGGLDNPQAKLTVYNSGPVASNQFELRTNHLKNPERYFMKNIVYGTGVEEIMFYLKHDGQMFINGNVGIGTNTPKGKIHIGDDSGSGVEIDNRISNVASQIPAQIFWAESSPSTQAGDLILAPRTDISTSIAFYTNNGSNINERLRIAGNGNMVLHGKFEAKEVKVTSTPTADFVFEKEYDLPKLEEVEKHIKDKKHLPEIASAKEMEKNGVNVGEFQIQLLQKIEELTLYSIEQNKKLKLQSEKVEKLEKLVEKLLSEKK